MTDIETEIARRHEARMALVTWAAAHRKMTAARDGLIRDAIAAGVSKAEIAKIVGVSRQHLYIILGRDPR